MAPIIIKKNYKRRSNKNKKKTKKIKNLGKKSKTYKRIQYGCTSKNKKGGGPILNPIHYISKNIDTELNNNFNKFMGNDLSRN